MLWRSGAYWRDTSMLEKPKPPPMRIVRKGLWSYEELPPTYSVKDEVRDAYRDGFRGGIIAAILTILVVGAFIVIVIERNG